MTADEYWRGLDTLIAILATRPTKRWRRRAFGKLLERMCQNEAR